MKYKRAKTPSEVAKAHAEASYTDAEAIAADVAKLDEQGLLIREWSAADVAADPERIGLKGSPTKVKAIMSVVLTASEAKKIAPTEAGVAELVHELIADHTLG